MFLKFGNFKVCGLPEFLTPSSKSNDKTLPYCYSTVTYKFYMEFNFSQSRLLDNFLNGFNLQKNNGVNRSLIYIVGHLLNVMFREMLQYVKIISK